MIVDLPKDVQLASTEVDWDVPMNLPGYRPYVADAPKEKLLQVAAAIRGANDRSCTPGGGVIGSDASKELRSSSASPEFLARRLSWDLVLVPTDYPLSLDMLGMHGAVYANYAVRDCDLSIALGVRFDDRVTGQVEAFAKHAQDHPHRY